MLGMDLPLGRHDAQTDQKVTGFAFGDQILFIAVVGEISHGFGGRFL